MSVVAYHYPCPDGAFGALAATLGLRGHEASSIRSVVVPLHITEYIHEYSHKRIFTNTQPNQSTFTNTVSGTCR